MAEINSVVLVGRLTRDAELKYTQGGTAVVKFSLALNRRVKKGDSWEDQSNFFDVSMMGKGAESVHKYLTKGKQIAVQGELRQNRWEQDGQARSKVEVFAFSLQLLGDRGGSGNTQGSGQEEKPDFSKIADPAARARAEEDWLNKTAGPRSAYSGAANSEEFEDDIPF